LIDLVDFGTIFESAPRVQALRRVSAFADISPSEVRAVVEDIGDAMAAALNGRGREMLPRFPDIEEQLDSACAHYVHLRDCIAGRLDRMEADQRPSERTNTNGVRRSPTQVPADGT
jgi:hypothetical protein